MPITHISRPNIEFVDGSDRLKPRQSIASSLLTNPAVASAIIISIALIIAASIHRPQRNRFDIVDDTIVIDHDTGRCRDVVDCMVNP